MAMQNIAGIREEILVDNVDHVYGEENGEPIRLTLPGLISIVTEGFDNRYCKYTVWPYATAQVNNFEVPLTYPGNVGDLVIMTNGSGTGGSIWECYRVVPAYGSTSYYWRDTDFSGKMDKIYVVNNPDDIPNVPAGQMFTCQGSLCMKSSSGFFELAYKSAIPTKVSDLSNDSGFLVPQVSIPDVPITLTHDEYVVDTESTEYAGVPSGQFFKAEIGEVYHVYMKIGTGYIELSNLAYTGNIPVNVSQLNNDSGFINRLPEIFIGTTDKESSETGNDSRVYQVDDYYINKKNGKLWQCSAIAIVSQNWVYTWNYKGVIVDLDQKLDAVTPVSGGTIADGISEVGDHQLFEYQGRLGYRFSSSSYYLFAKANDVYTKSETDTKIAQEINDLVADVEPIESGIRVTFVDGSTQDIPIESGGLAFDGGYVDAENMIHFTQNGEDVEGFEPFELPAGGGGSSSGSIVRVINGMASRNLTVMTSVEHYSLAYSWSSVDTETGDTTGSGTASWYVNGVRVATQPNISQGSQTFDVRAYLTEGTENSVRLLIEDAYGVTKPFTWAITMSSVELSWNLDEIGYHGEDAVTLRLTPTGYGEKTITVKIDGASVYTATTSASTGRAITVVIPAQSHGAHTITAQMSVVTGGDTVETEPLVHTGLWTASGNNTTVIGISKNVTELSQFETGGIKFMVISPSSETSSITQSVNGTQVSAQTVSRDVQNWAYRPTVVGTDTLKVACGAVEATHNITVNSIGITVEEVAGAVLTVDPTGHTNSEANRNSFGYKDENGTNHPFTYSANFDWERGGFQTDNEGVTGFLIKRGTYIEMDRSLFNDNARSAGKNIKMIFKTENARVRNADIGGSVSGGIGLHLYSHKIALSSTLETVEMPICTGKKIELDVNIESDGAQDHRIALIYLKSIPSRGFVYSADDSWVQAVPANMRIGSSEADVWIYKIKMYPTVLTRYEILDNYIADCANVEEMRARYERNDVYSDNGKINPEKLADKNPNCHVINIMARRLTSSKDDNVICDVRHILKGRGALHNFLAKDVTFKAQGTSSLDYILAALNLDVDFSNSTSWVDAEGNTIVSYPITENGIPVTYINIKLNVASSENANNDVLADDYNTFQPFLTPARQADSRVRDTVAGEPCVVFFTNTSDETIQVSSHTVAPGETIFYGCGDINNSKKNNAVFGQSNATYEHLCCIEIINNNSPQCLFKSDDLTNEDWTGKNGSCFEPRYPKTLTATQKAAFQAMLSWVVSTDTTAATGDALQAPVTYGGVQYTHDTAAYRGAKFKAEVGDYFSVDSLTYHYLFTERHCMVDNRAKNTFISYEWDTEANGYRWNFTKDYDNDTAEGNDNSGGMTFTYGLEDIDSINGAMVFNAYNSVLWCNTRDFLKEKLIAMYKDRESLGAWSATRILNKFKAHQGARPEAAYIEDAFAKYIAPFLATGETRYFGMLYGTKEYDREDFEESNELYFASKYDGALATSDSIEFRASSQIDDWIGVEPNGDMVIVPYSDMHVHVRYGNAGSVKVRAKAGQQVSIVCPTENLVDTETYIYLASNISAISGIAGLYTRVATLSSAKRLQRLELGSSVTGYQNKRLTQISFGNNPMLEEIDLRGTPNLVQALDLSQLEALRELFLSSSGVTGVTFAPGAPVTTVWLPAVQNLIARGLTALATFRATGTALSKLWVEDTPAIDTYALVAEAENLYRGRLINVQWDDADTDVLLSLVDKKGIDNLGGDINAFVLTGDVTVDTITQAELTRLNTAFPGLTVHYTSIVPAYTVNFIDDDGEIVNTQIVRQGCAAKNPISNGLISVPLKESSVEYTYAFAGWDKAFNNVTQNLNVNATFTASTRYYNVNWWYDNSRLLYSERIEAHGSTAYDGEDLTPPADKLWLGWDKLTNNIVSDLDVYASFLTPVLPDVVAVSYDYLYSDDPEDESAYTLAELFGIQAAGRESEFFNYHDKIKIVPTTNAFADSSIEIKVGDFNHSRLADGSGLAQVDWVMVGVMNQTRQMNSQNTNVGGIVSAPLYDYINNTVFPNLPRWCQLFFKQIVARSSAGGTSSNIVTRNCYARLLVRAEVGFNANEVPYKNEVDSEADHVTMPIFTDNASRIAKTYNGEGSATTYFLGSPEASGSSSWGYVYGYGPSSNGSANSSYGVRCSFSS